MVSTLPEYLVLRSLVLTLAFHLGFTGISPLWLLALLLTLVMAFKLSPLFVELVLKIRTVDLKRFSKRWIISLVAYCKRDWLPDLLASIMTDLRFVLLHSFFRLHSLVTR